MAVKKSQLYSSLWASCDKLRGGMDASQYKDYILTLLFIKYVSDKYKDDPYGAIAIPDGASFEDLVALKGNKIVINAGYSHQVEMDIPEGITVEVPSNTELTIKGIDKVLVGEYAANVRKVRQPEPYKGKGIRYKDEHIRRKEGKKAA